jgi:hypothetical protein
VIALLLSLLGFSGSEPEAIAQAIARRCPDVTCLADGLVYAKGEGGFRLRPRPQSSDARAGVSCGPLQTPCWLRTLDEQVTHWVRLRAWSLEHCGDLTGLASGQCGRGVALVRAREAERDGLLYVASWEQWP